MTFVIDLPRPPSKNASHGFGRGRVFLSKAYVQWREVANKMLLASGKNRGLEPIAGEFDCSILYHKPSFRTRRADPQNIIDCTMDWLQQAGVVADDKNLRCLELKPADIPDECRFIVEAV